MTNQKIAVILGITGADGSILTKQLLNKNYYVIGCKRRTSTFNTQRIDDIYSHPNMQIEYFDLCDASSINRIVAMYKPNEFYNLAAQSFVKASFDVPENTMNGIINGTLYCLEAIKNIFPSCKYYNAASSEMYGNNLNNPLNENSKFQPVSPYAIAKLAAFNLTKMYRNSYNIFACSGILFNHEGEMRGETFVTRKITKGIARIKLGKQKTLELGNLDSYRDWGYAPEFCQGIQLMLQQNNPDDYVLATGESHSVKEFLLETVAAANFGIDSEQAIEKYVKINSIYFRPQEVQHLCGDYFKAKSQLGWEPKIKFKELVKLMYDYDFKSESL